MQKLYTHSLFIILSLVGFLPSVNAQEKDYIIADKLHWQNPKEDIQGQAVLFFDGATNHDSLGLLPVYHCFIPGKFPVDRSGIQLSDAIYEPFDSLSSTGFPDLDLIGHQCRIIISTATSRKIPQQNLYLLPLRKSNSGYERLVSFRLTISFKDDQTLEAGPADARNDYTDHSVLSTGDWYRFAVRETGIHKLSFEDLQAMGIDPGAINPRNIRIYGNGNGMLSEANATARTDDLIENAIQVQGESDGVFNPGDYVLFYGESPVETRYNPFYLQFEHQVNHYTDETYYFLTVSDSPGIRVTQGEAITGTPTHELYNFQEYVYHEKDSLNLIKSGKDWFGEVFGIQPEYNFPFELTGIDISLPVTMKVSLAARSAVSTVFNIYTEGDFLTDVEVPSVLLSAYVYAKPVISNYESFYAKDEAVNIRIEFERPDNTDFGWLDFIQLNYTRHFNFTGGQLDFRDMRYAGPGNIVRFHVQTINKNLSIWEVTDPGAIKLQVTAEEAGGISMKAPADIYREFIAFDGTQFLEPIFIEKVSNQDLHGIRQADYIIVSHPMFLDQAGRLADHHRQYNDLNTVIVTPQLIYNEFSSGAQDVSAIRDFVKMLYDRAEPGQEPRYLLLFGDASYDYKGMLGTDHNFVPAYQSRESLKINASFVTDDFFACLDNDEGSSGSGTMDLGVGRFPVTTAEDAEVMVTKCINYMLPKKENFGPWRNEISFIGDDEDNNTHIKQAEGLVEITDSLGTVYNSNKIYLDAYIQQKTGSGARYPDVNKSINNDVSNGCLIMNYTGHGGEVAWAEERILDIPTIQSYNNLNNLPVFVTATCEFSRYDDPSLVSAGELVFLNPDGAGIALFTTTRVAFSTSNYAYNKRFYYEAFKVDSITGEYPRLGDLIMAAKTPSNNNIKNLVLLGDPAMMMAYPKMQVKTTGITIDSQERPADTIYALSRVTVEGQVEDLQGNHLEGFTGKLYASVYDKPVVYQTRANDPSSRVADFYIQNKKIFRGEATIDSGKFSFTFIVPVDISYQFGEGKISYYAFDTLNLTDAHGYKNIWIGGSDESSIFDEDGPEIDLFLNTLTFESGDITTPDPLLIANLFDESGINTVGNGIGHDIVAIVDGNYQAPIVLNQYFTPETDSYQKGMIQYRLGPFSNGVHTLTLKAWDVLNNSSEKTIEFQVNTGIRLEVSNLKSQPNPYRDQTSFAFQHNKPGSRLDVTINIYNLTGQHMTSLYYSIQNESIDSGLLQWDGRDASGNELSSGLYVYTLLVKSDDGYVVTLSQKLLHTK